MNRQQKENVVESLRKNFTQSNVSFLVGYHGLSVSQLQSLRNELRQHGGTMRIVKARLMKRAAQGLDGAQDLIPYFRNQVALVFASKEPSILAKSLHTFSKNNAAFSIVAGCLDDRVMDAQSVIRVASLPSKEVLLAKLLGTLQAPTHKLLIVLNMQILRLLWTLKKVAEEKSNATREV